jgi:hypothetical protein
LKLLPKAERQLVGQAIDRVQNSIGQPHLHSGIGLRKLETDLYECRCGLKTRLVFKLSSDGTLYFRLMGNHDEVIKFLKARR